MTWEFAVVLVAAFGAGLVDSMVGGGGLIQFPALFSTYPNVPPASLIGSSKFSSIFGTASSVWRFSRSVTIPWRMLLPFIVLTMIASSAGAFAVTLIPPDLFRPLIPVLLTVVLLYMLRRRDLGADHQPRVLAGADKHRATALVAAISFYEGFFGPGTGSFFMVLFVRLFGFDFLHAAASARLLNTAANCAAIGWFAARGHVIWGLAVGLAVANTAGALCGTRLAVRHGSVIIRKVFIGVVSALILKTAWDALH